MNTGEKKRFGCPTCGFRVSGSEDACPRCGARFGDDAKFECPFCGESVSPETTECPACHIPYGDFVSRAEEKVSDESIDSLLTEIIDIESREVREQGHRYSCPRCSWMVNGSEEGCPRCGVPFGESVAYQCPVCAAMVPAESSRCGECGAVFCEEEAPAEAAEPSRAVPAYEAPVGREPSAETAEAGGPTAEVGAEERSPDVSADDAAAGEAEVRPEAETTREDAAPAIPEDDEEHAEPGPERAAEEPREEPTPPKKKVRRRKLKVKPKS